MMTSPTLLVLAAGMGSRYGGMKQIDPIGPNGETIMDYSIYDAHRAGFNKLVFVIRKDMAQSFRQAVGARFEKHIEVAYVFQELDDLPPGFSVPAVRNKPWGTLHAVLVAASAIDTPFAVINADDFYGVEAYRTLAQHLQTDTTNYAMVGFVLRNTLSDFGPVSRGVCSINSNDLLQGITELTNIERDGKLVRNIDAKGCVTQLTGDELVSMNMWGLTPKVFAQLEEEFKNFLERSRSNPTAESYLPTAINKLILSGRALVKVLRTNDSWFGITYREDRQHVVEEISHLIEKGDYPKNLL
jgi:NDP-sugar pyrophosphorylase family protein